MLLLLSNGLPPTLELLWSTATGNIITALVQLQMRNYQAAYSDDYHMQIRVASVRPEAFNSLKSFLSS